MDNKIPNQNDKVPFDPGWNDPPTFSYNVQQTQPSRPRNFLNKRVAFPLTTNNVPTNNALPNSLPPIPTAPMPPTHLIQNTSERNDKNCVVFNSDSLLEEVKLILLTFLTTSSELGSKAKDIERRIENMEQMWKSGKLNKEIQLQMKELACALRDDQPSKADDIHRALMVDHVSAVGTWMPGVKQLVHHCIARSELMSIEKDS